MKKIIAFMLIALLVFNVVLEVSSFASKANTHTIASSATKGGTISPKGNIIIKSGATQKFTIKAKRGYRVKDVVVDGKSYGPLSGFTFKNVRSNHEIKAIFSKRKAKKYTITSSATKGGTISPKGKLIVKSGTTKEYTIKAKKGYRIKNVVVDGKSYGPLSAFTFINVRANHEIKALFSKRKAKKYTIISSATKGGTISPRGKTIIKSGTTQKFTIKAKRGYRVSDVVVDGKSYGPLASFTFKKVSLNHEIKAVFSKKNAKKYTITSSATKGGTISPKGKLIVKSGTTKKYRIKAKKGYRVKDVIVNGKSYGPLSSFTFKKVRSNHQIKAIFSKRKAKKYTITSSATKGGTISPIGKLIVKSGTTKKYRIKAKKGYRVKDIVVDGKSYGPLSSFAFKKVRSNHQIKAIFSKRKAKKYAIISSATKGGTISPKGKLIVKSGTTKKYTIKAKSGYRVSDVIVDGKSYGPLESFTFKKVRFNHKISASFEKNKIEKYTITSSATKGGTISPIGKLIVEPGTTKKFIIKAKKGYHVSDVVVDGKSYGPLSGFTFNNVRSNHKISASFEKDEVKKYTITSSATKGGTISPTGNIVLKAGTTQKFVIKSKKGYRVIDVVVDGKSYGPLASFTFINIHSNHSIKATFEKIKE